MRECRFFPWCSYIEDHGCTKDSCRHYQPMPDVDALLALADKVVADTEEDVRSEDLVSAWQAGEALRDVASKIREACGEVPE